MSKADHSKRIPSRGPPAAAETARRLIGSQRTASPAASTRARIAAAACDHLYRELSRWVGPDGCHALFTRALTEARRQFPAVGAIQLHARSDPYTEGVAEAIMAHGDPATADGLEALLIRLIEILGRLIGDDMSTILIERSLAATARGDRTPDSKREEA
jgi:hypothetical protein